MPLNGAVHTGTAAAVSLADVGVPAAFKQLDIYGNSGNASNAYIGSALVEADGTVGAWIQIAKGKSFGTKAEGIGSQIDIDPASTYVIADTDELVHFVWVT